MHAPLRYYWEQMLEAVQTIHDAGVVHADIKPNNFVLVRGHLKLIDFGLAGGEGSTLDENDYLPPR